MRNRDFIIKQHSTLPEVKFPLRQKLMEKYDITDDMMENVAVTFSMIDAETGLYEIANVEAKLVVIDSDHTRLDDYKYNLQYRFNVNQTAKVGRYYGEFKLDFLGDYCGKITLPSDDEISIYISPASTKTTVI